MSSVAGKLLTADEFFEWAHRPENAGRYWELERGEVIEMPPPGDAREEIHTWIGHLLWQYVIQRGLGRVSGKAGLIVERDPVPE